MSKCGNAMGKCVYMLPVTVKIVCVFYTIRLIQVHLESLLQGEQSVTKVLDDIIVSIKEIRLKQNKTLGFK